jgi:hypothetical protein
VDAVRDDLVIDHYLAPDGVGRILDFDIRLALDRPVVARSDAEGPKAKAGVGG